MVVYHFVLMELYSFVPRVDYNLIIPMEMTYHLHITICIDCCNFQISMRTICSTMMVDCLLRLLSSDIASLCFPHSPNTSLGSQNTNIVVKRLHSAYDIIHPVASTRLLSSMLSSSIRPLLSIASQKVGRSFPSTVLRH
jgi:hypothetical protein